MHLCAILPLAADKPRVPYLRTLKSRKVPREFPGPIHGALAQLVEPLLLLELHVDAQMSNVSGPADEKRGKPPRERPGITYGALAQLVARDIRIVEVRGSTPLCSTPLEVFILKASSFFIV